MRIEVFEYKHLKNCSLGLKEIEFGIKYINL